jgi:hypothetical protein
VTIANEKWIEARRIRVQRDGKHVSAAVKDALRTIAVMNVDIEYRHAVEAPKQELSCDRRII